jgi:hypothetical protein
LQSEPGASDYINAHFEFHKEGGGEFDCSLIEAELEAFAFLAPYFAVADIELGAAISVLCACLSDGGCTSDKRNIDNSTLIEEGGTEL